MRKQTASNIPIFFKFAAQLIWEFFRALLLVEHKQAAFNWLSSCFLLNSISWQKTVQLLALCHSQETNWGGSLAVTIPVQGSMSILVSCQGGFTCTENSTQQPRSCMTDTWCQRAEKLWQLRQTWRKQAWRGWRVGGNICFLHFLVAQLLCSSIFTVLKARQFHLQ